MGLGKSNGGVLRFARKINVENQVLGGTSSRTYPRQPGIGIACSARVKPGDFVMMQFGHNDGGGATNGRGSLRGNGEETQDVAADGQSETVHTYGWYLRKYIADAKAKRATPIVCSLIPRNTWRDGKVARGTGSYGTWAAEAAKQGDALFIDLNGIIADHYDKLGEEAVASNVSVSPINRTRGAPRMTTRLNRGSRGGRRRDSVRKIHRIGHVSSIATADSTAMNTARNEPANAKPAQGPM